MYSTHLTRICQVSWNIKLSTWYIMDCNVNGYKFISLSNSIPCWFISRGSRKDYIYVQRTLLVKSSFYTNIDASALNLLLLKIYNWVHK